MKVLKNEENKEEKNEKKVLKEEINRVSNKFYYELCNLYNRDKITEEEFVNLTKMLFEMKVYIYENTK